jgi:hypothetical protein
MLPRSLLLASLLALVVPGALGCSSSTSEDETTEGELGEGSRPYNFNPRSALESRGEVDENNAYWAAKLSAVSYEAEDNAGLERLLRDLHVPFEEAIVFHADESQAKNPLGRYTGTSGMYVRTRDAGFLVFRGSEDGKYNDAITDMAVMQVEARLSLNRASAGKVHAGFHVALHSVWQGVREKLIRRHGTNQQRGRLPLYIMGHSLGGALGTLAMHQLLFDKCLNSDFARIDLLSTCDDTYVPVKALYTFGSPRTGNEEFTTMLVGRAKETGTKVFRFVNEGDQVSMLPRYAPVAVVEPFRHVGDKGDETQLAILLLKDGHMEARPRNRCEANEKLVQCDISLWEGLGGVTSGRPPWKIEHSRNIYLEKLRAKVSGTVAQLEKFRQAEAQDDPAGNR